MIDFLVIDIGGKIVEGILGLAALLTGEGLPGLISLGLIFLLVVLSAWHGRTTWQFCREIRSILDYLREGGGRITRDRKIDVDQMFRGLREGKGFRRRLGIAWDEFEETTVLPMHETDKLRNTARPEVFFSREEMGLERGIWRQIPALFVSVGLLLTFLGLVAALDQTGDILDTSSADGNVAATEGLKTLLQIASAKFVMSLTGLLCSIIFTVVLRASAHETDKVLSELCMTIEEGCDFLTDQRLLSDVLDQSKQQTDQLQAFSTELVAQIAKPLQEELQGLPGAIHSSIQEVMSPAMEALTSRADAGIEAIVSNVSTELSGGIQESISSMTQAMESVRQHLGTVADRLDATATNMGGGVENAVQSLNEQIGTLQGAMAESSTLMMNSLRDGTNEMLETTQNNIARVGESIGNITETTGQRIRSAGDDMATVIQTASNTMREEVLNPMDTLTEVVSTLSSRIEEITRNMGEYLAAITQGATTVSSANNQLEDSTRLLTLAATPIRDTVGRLESTTRTMGERVESAAQAIGQSTEHTEAILSGVRKSIEASQQVLQGSMQSLAQTLREFREVVTQLQGIDDSLGDAFNSITATVQERIGEIARFNQKLHEEFTTALSHLETVMAQAEPFTPRRTNG